VVVKAGFNRFPLLLYILNIYIIKANIVGAAVDGNYQMVKFVDGIFKKVPKKKTTESSGKLEVNKKTKQSSKKTISKKGLDFAVPKKINFLKIAKASTAAFLFLATALLMGVFLLNVIYADKNIPGLRVAGQSVGGLTPDEAKKILDQATSKFLDQKITFIYGGGEKSWETTPGEIGLSFSNGKSISEIFAIGHSGNLKEDIKGEILTLLGRKNKNFDASFQFDDLKVDAFLAKISQDINSPVKNATLKFEGLEAVVVAEEAGQLVPQSEIKKLLSLKIAKLDTNKIVVFRERVEPAIKEKDTLSVKAETAKLVSMPVEFTYNNKSFTVDQQTVASWISFVEKQESGKLVLGWEINAKNFQDYLVNVKKLQRAAVDKQIQIISGQEYVLREGKPGQTVDVTDASLKLKDQLLIDGERKVSLITAQLPPKTVTVGSDAITPASMEPYIDIDISSQVMTIFSEGQVVYRFRVSTGKWEMPTPLGWGKILNKQPRAYSKKYGLYMPWWMAFQPGGYGIHELPEWPNGAKEGQGHLGRRVSHGCIRLGIGPAKTVYDWASVGTPVYVHN